MPLMKQPPRTLDASYRARAIPMGSKRYWSWLFASSQIRAPLLGIYALLAEWSGLMDPATDRGAAHIKLGWWQEEMRRLVAGEAVHPIGAYLQSLPRASAVDFTPLEAAIDAAATETAGVPLERSAELLSHAGALRAGPLALASRLAEERVDEASLTACTEALAMADYLSRSIRDYRREARFGRISFAVDELLAAGIDNADLTADVPPARLDGFLHHLRERAARNYAVAARALPPAHRSRQRHLLVLAALGLEHLRKGPRILESRGLQDMLLAWTTARRANQCMPRSQ
jgi:15-cis-phytoene synthase